ncbi:MAG: hypothetical protein AAGA68_15190 [Pseudomonadota bacterium]
MKLIAKSSLVLLVPSIGFAFLLAKALNGASIAHERITATAPAQDVAVSPRDNALVANSAADDDQIIEISPVTSDVVEVSSDEFAALQEESAVVRKRNGWIDLPNDQPAYLTYDNDLLEALVAYGDVIAADWLGTKYSWNDPATSKEIFTEAAIFGSTAALVAIAQMQYHMATGSLTEAGAAKKMSKQLDVNSPHLDQSVAWAMVALARGDELAISFLNDLASQVVAFAPARKAYVCEEFHRLYNEIAREREQRGMRPFSNTPSPIVNISYQSMSVCNEWPTASPVCKPAQLAGGRSVGYVCGRD